MTLALVPIIIRISLRTRNRGLSSTAANLADGFIILAWIAGAILIIINTWKNTLRMKYLSTPKEQLYYGVPPELSGHLLYVSWISLFFIYISLWSAKAAFLAFYYSIFSLQGKTARITLAVASVFTAATFLLHMFLIAFWCSPVSANWAPPPGGSLCSAVHSISSVTISTFTNVATDLVILAIPISTLMATKLGSKERAGLAFVFLMGSVSIIAALVRFGTLKAVQSVPKASITHTIDVWALVEIVSSILAICLPALRAFVRKHTTRPNGSPFGSTNKSSSHSGNNSISKGSVTRLVTVSSKDEELEESRYSGIEEVNLRTERGEKVVLGLRNSGDKERDLVYVKRPEAIMTQAGYQAPRRWY